MMPEHRICNGFDFDLVYSPDDGGYYWQRWADNETSEILADRESAMRNLRSVAESMPRLVRR